MAAGDQEAVQIAAQVGVGVQIVLARLVAAIEVRGLVRGADLAADLDELVGGWRTNPYVSPLVINFLVGTVEALRQQGACLPRPQSSFPAGLRVVGGRDVAPDEGDK